MMMFFEEMGVSKFFIVAFEVLQSGNLGVTSLG